MYIVIYTKEISRCIKRKCAGGFEIGKLPYTSPSVWK